MRWTARLSLAGLGLAFLALMVIAWVSLSRGEGAYDFSFASFKGTCATANQSSASFSLWNGRILLNGSVVTPHPCYSLDAELQVEEMPNASQPRQLVVRIIPRQRDTTCVMCSGEVRYGGAIGPLPPGLYNVSVLYEGETIARQVVERQTPELVRVGDEDLDSYLASCIPDFPHKRGIYLCDNRVFIYAALVPSIYQDFCQDYCFENYRLELPSTVDYPQNISVEIIKGLCSGSYLTLCSGNDLLEPLVSMYIPPDLLHFAIHFEIVRLDPGVYNVSVLWKLEWDQSQEVIIEGKRQKQVVIAQ